MAYKKRFNEDGLNIEDLENKNSTAEVEGFFGHLHEYEDECDCGYFGPMKSTRKGLKCPECKAIVVAIDDD